MSASTPDLTGIWLHSHEEDTDSIMVFRPRGYPLGPARWRDALEMRPDGSCIWHGSSADDRGEAAAGRWEALGNGSARLALPPGTGGPLPRRVQSWAADKLVLEK